MRTFCLISDFARVFLLALLFSALGLSQIDTTTVEGPLYGGDGSGENGRLEITWPSFTTSSGDVVAPGKARVTVTSGVLSVGGSALELVPTDTAQESGTVYTVQYFLGGDYHTEWWNVPTSASAVAVSSIRSFTATTQSTTVTVGNITGGSVKGDLIAYSGSAFTRIPAGTDDYCLIADSTQALGLKWGECGSGGSGTVTSVAASAPSSLFSVAGSPVTTSGTLAFSFATGQTANYVFGTNGSGAVSLQALTADHIPDLSSVYESAFSAGTTGQYWRGDKSWQTLDNSAVGLGNVENTAISTWAGSTNVTTLGTIITGTWTGSAIGAAYLPAFTGLTDWPAGVDATEVGYLDGVTSSIQTQLGAKITNPMTTAEDIIVGGASGTPGRLAAGSEGTVLKIVSGSVAWGTDSTGGTPAFSDVGAGTNTSAAMVVGTGASLGVSGSGTIAATSSAQLAANGANCSAGNYPLGVDASGAVESCTADDTGTDTLDDLSDDDIGALQNVTESTPGNDEVLQYVTDHWENQTLAEAGIQAAISLGTGVETWLGTPSSANLAAALTDEVGNTGGFTRGTAGSTDDCVKWDANGNLVTAGAACGSGGAALPTQTGNSNKVLSTDGSAADWRAIGAGLVNDATSLRVDSSTVALLSGTQTVGGDKTFTGDTAVTGAVDFSGSSATQVCQSGTTPPGTCAANSECFIDTDDELFLICDSAGTGWDTYATSAGGGGGGAPTDAKYIVQTADGTLSAEQALGALATGILKNTTTTGVLSIAAAADIGALSANLDDTDASIEWEDAAALDADGSLSDSSVADADLAITVAIQTVIGNGTDVLSTGVAGYLEVPFACTITQITGLADQSGSAVVDVWKDSYANYPPTDADTITASAPLTLSTAIKAQDATLTGWTTSISAGDILGFNVDSATTITQLTVSIKCTR